MAAGRYGGYRHDSEFDVKSSRRKDYHHDRYRDDDRERGRVVDLRDRLSDRRRDDRTREVVNGYHCSNRSGSNSSGSGSDLKRVRSDEKLVEREPGELSSGGESPVENSAVPSPGKKRKFSPISQEKADGRPSPNAPTLQNGYVSSRPVVMEQLPEENATRDKWWQDDQEPGEMVMEDEENAPMRNISSSRWADGDDFMDGGKTMAKTKKENSPELGEVASREGSQGTASNPSSSGGEHKDDCKVQDVEGDDYMDIDEKDDGGNSNSHSSDTESESGDSGVQTPDPPETPGQEQPPERSLNMTQGCRSVDEFERLNKINEGTYGVVYRAMDKKTGEIVALKKVKMEKEREGFPLTSLREINILLSLQHASIVGVKEVVVGSNLDSIFMVMEYMDHDLKALMEAMKQPFSQSEVKCLMLQLLEGINYLHDNWVLHRDLKTSNLLVNNCGELKICDFGLSRQYGSPLKPYTHLVVTLWYRAPELLLGAKEYSTAIDMWSLGCILAELLAKEPLFSGKNELDQLDKIFRILGTPNEKIWPRFTKLPGVKMNFVRQPYNKLREKFPPITSFSGRPTLSEAGFDLLNRLLTYDPDKRITAEDALNHPWFREVPLPKSKEFMPTYPAQNAHDRCKRRIMKSPDPLEEQRRKELKGDVGGGGLFG